MRIVAVSVAVACSSSVDGNTDRQSADMDIGGADPGASTTDTIDIDHPSMNNLAGGITVGIRVAVDDFLRYVHGADTF